LELAQSIASSMELKEKSNIISGEVYQREFDTIVTSKLVGERQPMPMMAPGGFASQNVITYATMDFAPV
jgi:hypothetical protein